jgi:hypothetical protein
LSERFVGQTNLLYPNRWDRSCACREPGGGWARFDPTPLATGRKDWEDVTYQSTGGPQRSLTQNEEGTRQIKSTPVVPVPSGPTGSLAAGACPASW